jgi:hypothetical protein
MDEFTRRNRPIDANKSWPSTPGASPETEREDYEEQVRRGMIQGGTSDRSRIVRLLCNSPDANLRRRARAELRLPPEDDLEEDNGPDSDPRITMLRRATRLQREQRLTLTEAVERVKLQDPALLCHVANCGYGPYEYRLAEGRSALEPTPREHPQSRIARALGLDPLASKTEIREAIGRFTGKNRSLIAHGLGLDDTASDEAIRNALDDLIPDDDEADVSAGEPSVPKNPGIDSRSGRVRVPRKPVASGPLRLELAEHAERLATERGIPYAQALREIVAQDPAAYQRALLEYY